MKSKLYACRHVQPLPCIIKYQIHILSLVTRFCALTMLVCGESFLLGWLSSAQSWLETLTHVIQLRKSKFLNRIVYILVCPFSEQRQLSLTIHFVWRVKKLGVANERDRGIQVINMAVPFKALFQCRNLDVKVKQ